jgi:hypothetical protein
VSEPLEAHELLRQIRANMALLEGCPGPHDFHPFGDRPIFRKSRCSKCGGELGCIEVQWYERGLAHGGKQ